MASTTLVPVTEVLEAVGGMHWLDAIGAKVSEDWLGRACVTERDAEAAMKAFKADLEAQRDREARYAAAVRTHDAERAAVGQRAAETAFTEAREREVAQYKRMQAGEIEGTFYSFPMGLPPAGPECYAAASAARREALARFDRKHPPIAFESFK
jgi:hypothetical protein